MYMMTDLESAIYLAWKAITERYPETHNLSYTEKQDYYRELIRRLQQMLPEGKEQKE
jgi:hypothetical protein